MPRCQPACLLLKKVDEILFLHGIILWLSAFSINIFPQDDEFAVYDTTQQRIRYLVEFTLPGDKPKELNVPVGKEAAILDQEDTDVEMVSGDSVGEK